MAVTVRPARPGDRAAVKRMLGEFVEYLNAIEPSDDEADLDFLVDQSFGPDPVCATLIAERAGQAVGYVGYHPGVWEIWRSLYVISLFVRAEARGTGAGRALIDAVKDVARAQRAQRIVWEVWRKNPLAIDFYKGIGGEVFDENLRMSLVVE
ncbi:N-acetyltransferase family protein [Dongia sp. agr-C8]